MVEKLEVEEAPGMVAMELWHRGKERFSLLLCSLCLVLGLCSYVLVLMFKFVIMFLCVLVQNELDLNLCILFFLILKLDADVAFFIIF